MEQRHVLCQVTKSLICLNWKLINILCKIQHFNINSFKSFTKNDRNIRLVIRQLYLHGRVVLVEWVRTLKHVAAGDTSGRSSYSSLTCVLLMQVILRIEVVRLLLGWINTTFRSVDMAFSILSTWLLLLNVKSILLDITILILNFSSVINCDMFVRVLLVHFRQMFLSKVQDLVSDVANVPFFRSLFYFIADNWVLFEDFF